MLERIKRLVVERLGVNRVAAHADRLEAELHELRATQDGLYSEIRRLEHELFVLSLESTYLGEWTRIRMASDWAAAAPLLHEPTVSIVLPTRNRAAMLRRAVDSVIAQTYPNWQLVVVDDGSSDGTPDLLAELRDDRVIRARTDGIGAAAARNRGLELATGEYVTFLDDDNAMAPGWLRAVAEHTGRHPDCDLLYGAQIRESEPGEEHLRGRRSVSGLHLLFVDPFDRAALLDRNYVDLGVIAVRRSHPELHFDETLDIFIDWELVARLTASTTPHPLPVLASLYRTGASDRITSSEDREHWMDEMRRRLAALADD